MIGNLTVNISAKDPTRKCETLRAFLNSPSTVRIVGVPSALGKWKISKVYFTVNYPDNTSVSKECTAGVGVYVATVAGSTSPGKSTLGYTVKADGTDETGTAIVGYVLGAGDVEIADTDGTVTTGETTWYIHVLSEQPTNPRKGDAYVDSGVWWFYNGTSWVTLGGTFAGNGWAQYPQSEGGDGKWHRVIISNGALAYDETGYDEPTSDPFALKSYVDAKDTAEATARDNADATKVPLDGAATVNGVKTFTSSPIVPTPTANMQAATKKYADDAVAAEATARANADSAEVTARNAAIAALGTDLTNNLVHKSGAETITGKKTFSNVRGIISIVAGFKQSETPTSTIWGDHIVVLDEDGLDTFILENCKTTSGDQKFSIVNKVGSSARSLSISFNGSSGTVSTSAEKVYGSAFAVAAMPSTSHTSITPAFNASGNLATSFTPTVNGWVSLVAKGDATVPRFTITASRSISGIEYYLQRHMIEAADSYGSILIPVNKGVSYSFYGALKAENITQFELFKCNAEVA